MKIGGWLVALLVGACVADDGGPRLDTATPTSAQPDAMVTITGTRLCGASMDCNAVDATFQIGLQLPSVDAQVAAYTETSATIVIPDDAPVGMTSIVVTVDDKASNALSFEVLP